MERAMKLLKEPLLHFVVIGGLLFAAHAALAPSNGAEITASTIHLTAADAEWLKQTWTRQWNRSPTDEELRGLFADQLKEEVLSREARALELDVGDTIVRRRLAQKMAFLLDDTIRTAQPTEADLRALYEKRPELFQTPPRVSFTQVFFRRGDGDGAARTSLAALSEGNAVPDEVGERLLLGDTFADQDEQALTNLFGAGFSQAILTLPLGRWSGPIASGYGLHLVKVTAIEPAQSPPFADVRERLAEEWRRERQDIASAQHYQDLLGKYRLVVDPAVRPWLSPLQSQSALQP
jgi:hypothetical protein